MNFNLNDFLGALSSSLDFVEIDLLGASSNHSKRVVYISLKIAGEFCFTDDEKFDLCSFALLHDNGLCAEALQVEPPREAKKNTIQQLERYTVHCDIGEENVRDFPFFTNIRNVIKYHHENYDGSGIFGLKGDEIPLMSQIIALADTVDNLFHFETPSIENRKKIIDFISKKQNIFYSEALVNTFLKVSSNTSFWLDLQEPFLHQVLKKLIPEKTLSLSLQEIYKITKVFSSIIDSKSRFTQHHSSGLKDKNAIMADFYNFSSEKKQKLLIAANLHDLGKLAIPNAILDKPGRLTDEEFEIIKSHTYFTRVALEKIAGFEEITNWAANHHEKLDSNGYPFGFKGENLGFEERLMTCLDIYQALTEDRPYRAGMSHTQAIEILQRNASRNFIDKDIVSDIDNVFGE